MAITQLSKIQTRSGDLADLPQLAVGEIGWATDEKKLFIGNDTNTVGLLPENTEVLTEFSNIPAPGINKQVLFNSDGILGSVGSMTSPSANPNTVFEYDYLAGNANTGELTVNNVEVTDHLRANTLIVGNGGARIFGDLNVDGNITFVNQTSVSVDDPVIWLGANSAGNLAANLAAGILMNYSLSGAPGDGANAFMGYLPANGTPANTFVLLSNVTGMIDTNVTGVFGDLKLGNIDSVGSISGNFSAPGTNTQVMFNDGGFMNANVGFTFNKTNDTVFSSNAFSSQNVFATTAIISPTITQGSSNIRLATGGNVTISSAGVSNVFTVTNIGANLAGVLQVSGNITTTANASVGNVNASNGVFSSNIQVTGSVNSANLVVSNNANIGNIANVSNLSVTSNVISNLLPDPSSDGIVGLDLGRTGQRWRSPYFAGPIFIGTNGTTSNISTDTNGNIVVTTGGGANFSLSGLTPGTGTLTVPSINATVSFTTPSLISSGGLSATGTITGGNLATAGNLTVGGNSAITGNTTIGGTLAVTGNTTTANIATTGVITATSTITGGNLVTGGNLTVGGNTAITGNLTVTGTLNATITGNATGLANGTSTISIPAASGNVNVGVGGVANVLVITSTGANVSGTFNSSGNITGGNLVTGGNLSVTGTSNLGAVGNITITGGTTGQFLQTNGSGVLSWVTVGTSGIANGTSSVSIPVVDSNVITTVGGTARLTVTTAGANITGTLTTSTSVQTPNLTTGANTTAGTITGNWTLTTGSRLNATYADLAEKYASDRDYPPGTLVMIGGDKEVTLATLSGKWSLAGVVTSEPAYVLNSTLEDSVTIALVGRVPCLVTGNISKGDMLTISNIAGVATASIDREYGTIIGRALESYNSSNVGTIEIKVDRA